MQQTTQLAIFSVTMVLVAASYKAQASAIESKDVKRSLHHLIDK
ncbi:unnamed protein product, partial [Adineta steineri]